MVDSWDQGHAKSHKSVDSLKKSLLKEWSQIPQETIASRCERSARTIEGSS